GPGTLFPAPARDRGRGYQAIVRPDPAAEPGGTGHPGRPALRAAGRGEGGPGGDAALRAGRSLEIDSVEALRRHRAAPDSLAGWSAGPMGSNPAREGDCGNGCSTTRSHYAASGQTRFRTSALGCRPWERTCV